MEFNENTRIADLVAAYPWLPEKVAQMDERLRIVNTPIGRLLMKRATIGDASRRSGYSVERLIGELNKVIAQHEEENE